MLRCGAKCPDARLRHTGGMNTNRIAHLASLVGEPARTAMLLALMDGRALTAKELAAAAHISAATASRHLGLLVEAGLLVIQPQGRHRYHRLASLDVARMLEGLMQLAMQPPQHRPVHTGPRDPALRMARLCYDHVAGRLGVAIAAHLLDEQAIAFDEEGGGRVTGIAPQVLQAWGVTVPSAGARGHRKPWCRPCLDWSERRSHIGGPLGRLLCAHGLQSGWLLRGTAARALQVTPAGAVAMRHLLGLERWRFVTGDSAGE